MSEGGIIGKKYMFEKEENEKRETRGEGVLKYMFSIQMKKNCLGFRNQ